jgi:transposase
MNGGPPPLSAPPYANCNITGLGVDFPQRAPVNYWSSQLLLIFDMPNLKRRPRVRDAPKHAGADGDTKTRTQLTFRQRIEIQTLHSHSGLSYSQIADKLKIPRSTVRKVIFTPSTPKKPQGRPPKLNTPLRLHLIQRATLNAYHRRLTYEEVANLKGIQACRRTLRAAFKKHQYHRRVATEKPLLTEKQKQDHLTWAYTHKD